MFIQVESNKGCRSHLAEILRPLLCPFLLFWPAVIRNVVNLRFLKLLYHQGHSLHMYLKMVTFDCTFPQVSFGLCRAETAATPSQGPEAGEFPAGEPGGRLPAEGLRLRAVQVLPPWGGADRPGGVPLLHRARGGAPAAFAHAKLYIQAKTPRRRYTAGHLVQ